MRGLGCSLGFWVLGLKCRVQGLGSRGLGFFRAFFASCTAPDFIFGRQTFFLRLNMEAKCNFEDSLFRFSASASR